jgi:hypothetical protein
VNKEVVLHIGGSLSIYTQAVTVTVWTTLKSRVSKLHFLAGKTNKLPDDDKLYKHLRVYVLANEFCIEDLKTVSLEKFRRETREGWDSDLFLECVWEVYHSIPGCPHTIRPALIDVAVAHAREIAGKAGFQDLVREGGDFVVEYVTRLLMQTPWF